MTNHVLCSFRNVFGRPREGVHAVRLPVLDIAVVDLALTIVCGTLLATYMHWSVLLTNGIIMALSVVIHRAFCVDTALTVRIFGASRPPEL